jgi:hypothetical protein
MLIAAITRQDRCLYPVSRPKGGAVTIVARGLLKRGLVEETPAGTNIVWRYDDDGTALTLRATELAVDVLAGAEL